MIPLFKYVFSGNIRIVKNSYLKTIQTIKQARNHTLRKHFGKISFAFLILTFGFYFVVPTNNNYSSTAINTWLLIGLALTLIFAFFSPKNIWKKIVLTVITIAIVIFLFIAIAFGISGL